LQGITLHLCMNSVVRAQMPFLNLFTVFHQVYSSFSRFTLFSFTWFTRFIPLLQHCNTQTIHKSLVFFHSHVSPSCCPPGYLFTLHYIAGLPLRAHISHTLGTVAETHCTLLGSTSCMPLFPVPELSRRLCVPSRTLWKCVSLKSCRDKNRIIRSQDIIYVERSGKRVQRVL
jgi:hypothetical protein